MVPDWITAGVAGVGALSGLTALTRILVTHGADRAQISANKTWIADQGVERGEFENLERRMDDAAAKAELLNLERRVDEAATKGDLAALTRRVDEVEGDVSDIAKTLTDIRVELGQIPGQFFALRELSTLQFETMKHSISNLRQVVEGIANGHLPRGG